jgi:transposase
VRFFVSRLKHSRCVDVALVENEGVESLVRSLLSGFESFGGVPPVAVFDSPKTVVLSREGGRIQWNDTFGQAALGYRLAAELCTPRREQRRYSTENLAGFVKNGAPRARAHRVPEQGKDRIHPQDRTRRLAQVAGKRGRLYLKRQESSTWGPRPGTGAERSPTRRQGGPVVRPRTARRLDGRLRA